MYLIIETQYYDNKTYLLIKNGSIIKPVRDYLMFLTKVQKSPNTIKTYATGLKFFYMFLEEKNLEINNVNIDILSEYMFWLSKDRHASTINLYINIVKGFYQYLYRNNSINIDYQMLNIFSNYKYKNINGFLSHSKRKLKVYKNYLKIKEEKREVEIFSQDEISKMLAACKNIRDYFMIRLLYETGIRRGELVSLHVSDFCHKDMNTYYISVREHDNTNIRGANLKTGSRNIAITRELYDLFDEYLFDLVYRKKIKSDYVFVVLNGKNIGKPLEDYNINSIVSNIGKRANVHAYPHKFRHTNGTLIYNTTKNARITQVRLGHRSFNTTSEFYINSNLHEQFEEIKNVDFHL